MKQEDYEIEDCCTDIKMYFMQIVTLSDLLIETGQKDKIPNFTTLKEIAESGINKLFLLQEKL